MTDVEIDAKLEELYSGEQSGSEIEQAEDLFNKIKAENFWKHIKAKKNISSDYDDEFYALIGKYSDNVTNFRKQFNDFLRHIN